MQLFYVTVDLKSIWCSSDNQLSVGLISMGMPKCIVEVSHSDFHWLCLSFCCDYGLYHHRPLSNGTNNFPAVVINFLRWQGCKIHLNPEIDQNSQEDHVEDILAEMPPEGYQPDARQAKQDTPPAPCVVATQEEWMMLSRTPSKVGASKAAVSAMRSGAAVGGLKNTSRPRALPETDRAVASAARNTGEDRVTLRVTAAANGAEKGSRDQHKQQR